MVGKSTLQSKTITTVSAEMTRVLAEAGKNIKTVAGGVKYPCGKKNSTHNGV
jgi:hypothetical protein